jgi:hypothetical protein
MKNKFKILFVAILFGITASPLRAQTNAESGTNSTFAVSPTSNTPMAVQGSDLHNFGENLTQTIAVLIPIVAIVMSCSLVIIIIGLKLYFRHRKNKMLHETVRMMVDKGVPIPPEMFRKAENESMEQDNIKRPRNDLRMGLILTGIGIGIVLFIGKPGWIVLFLGVAFLVIASLDKKNKSDDQPPKQ